MQGVINFPTLRERVETRRYRTSLLIPLLRNIKDLVIINTEIRLKNEILKKKLLKKKQLKKIIEREMKQDDIARPIDFMPDIFDPVENDEIKRNTDESANQLLKKYKSRKQKKICPFDPTEGKSRQKNPTIYINKKVKKMWNNYVPK